MHTRSLIRLFTQISIVCFFIGSTLAGCDKRSYSTTVHSSNETAADSASGGVEGTASSTTDSFTDSITGSIADGAEGSAVDGTAEGAIDDPIEGQSILDPITGEPVAAAGGLPGSIGGALGEAIEDPLPQGEIAAGAPSNVPQGPDVERLGTGSIYQPFADVEVETFTIDGRRSRALAAVGAPVLHSPRELMEEIDEYYLNDASQVAFTGRYSQAGENAYALWAGDVSNPVQIFQTGTSIPGLNEGQTYFKTLQLALGEDGSLVQLAELQVPVPQVVEAEADEPEPQDDTQEQNDAQEQDDTQEQDETQVDDDTQKQEEQAGQVTLNQVYLASRGAQHTVLMRTNTSLQGLIGEVGIDSIQLTDHFANTHAVVSVEKIVNKVPVEPLPGTVVSAEDEVEEIEEIIEQYTLWFLNGGTTKAVAHSWAEKSQGASSLANGCPVYAPDNKGDNLRLAVTGKQNLVFQAQIGGDGDCEKARAVLRYEGGSLNEIVKDGDFVPGSTTHVFNDVSLYKVTDDGSVVVFANLATPAQLDAMTSAEATAINEQANRIAELTGANPENEEIDDGLWSFWIMPPQGVARLIALEGEEIQVGPAVSVFSGEPRSLSLQLNASNQLALKLTLKDSEQPVFFTGTGHSGQPHASIDVPGASALRYAFTSNSRLPGQGPDAQLGALGTPYLDATGNLVLYGEVKPSDEAIAAAAESNDTVADANTEVTPLIKPFNSIWQVDSQGVMRELVRSGDQVAVAGVTKELASLSVVGQIARPGSSGVRLNSAGALLLRATIDRRFGNPVLLYIAP